MADKSSKKIMGQSAPDEAWLAKVEEEALEPDLPIVDPHHHLWVRDNHRYLMPEFAEDLASGHNIVATVYAECHSMYRQQGPEELRSLGETEFVAGCAAMSDSGVFGPTRACQAMFGRVEMTLGEATRGIFEQHLERSGGRFRGIRYSTAWDESERINNVGATPHLLIEPPVKAAAAVMAEMNLTLDAWVYHPQLDDVAKLASEIPNLNIVLNHTGVPILGGPYREKRDEVFSDWQDGIRKVAACDNVYIKLGALPVRRPGDGIDRSVPPTSEEVAAAWAPWMDFCIEAFGPARSMFESNFPVQKLWSSYQVTWNAFKRIAAGASADEKRDLFGGAATAAYRLA
jgi:predicted TIM-barrel fold metal-dependent hydrolase